MGWSHRGITLSWGLIKPAQPEGLRLPPHRDVDGETKRKKDGKGTYWLLPRKASQVHLKSPSATIPKATVSKVF